MKESEKVVMMVVLMDVRLAVVKVGEMVVPWDVKQVAVWAVVTVDEMAAL